MALQSALERVVEWVFFACRLELSQSARPALASCHGGNARTKPGRLFVVKISFYGAPPRYGETNN